jgi:hypothetical protein
MRNAATSNMNNESDFAPASRPTVLRLPRFVTAESLAGACRDAWRVFVEQSEGWGKAELVLWSTGLYAPIARYTSLQVEHRGAEANDDYRFVDARFVERMIATARARAIEVLSSFILPRERLAFCAMIREERAVLRCEDNSGQVGFAPTPATDALVDRILSLIAADLMTCPRDFEGETLCSACGGVVMAPKPCCVRYEGRESSIVANVDTMPVTRRFGNAG